MATGKERCSILVTGATGFVGHHLMRLLANSDVGEGHRGIFQSHPPVSGGNCYLQCNLTNGKETTKVLESLMPQTIIHLAAISNAAYCETHAAQARKVNVDSTELLAEFASRHNCKLLFTSTDLVFDGEKGNYTETDPTNPLMEYGRQKAEAERLVLALGNNGLVARLSLMFGPVAGHHKNFTHHILTKLRAGESVSLFSDEYRSVHSVMETVRQLYVLATGNHNGIFHLGGPQRLSRFEFGMLAANTFGYSTSLLHPVKSSAISTGTPRPRDVSMNSTRFFTSTNMQPATMQQLLSEYRHTVT